MSDFNPDLFLANSTAEANAETYEPVPPGEYLAQISKVEPRQVTGKNGPQIVMDLTWKVQDEGNKAAHNRNVRQSIFIDTTAEGFIASGPNTNVQLGKLRASLKQNVAGSPWSPSMLNGQVARITVQHRVGEAGTKYAGRIFDEIGAVAGL
jgi:hypothetical protein